MAMMILTSEGSGAPTLNGVNGALTAVLRWALVQNGWAVEYGATGNAAVFRPGTGNRHRLSVIHDNTVSGSAALATVRGCEDASSATTLVDPFPQVSQVANNLATWQCSSAANSTARRYKILLWPTFFWMLVESNSDGFWEPYWFGDLAGTRAEDAYATAVACRYNSSFGTGQSLRYGYQLSVNTWPSSYGVTQVRAWWCRDISGAVKSTKGVMSASGAYLGQPASGLSAPAALSGYGNRIEREKIALTCMGDNGGSGIGPMYQVRRGWFPGMWSGLHSSYPGIASEDVFSDTEYNPLAEFMAFKIGAAEFCLFAETTDTWEPPSG